MILKKLVLTSFGKFNNRAINLKEGINVIFGHNEAGKTTVHKFIEGMLYGFYKPYTKRKLYTDDYDKYLPWGQNDFYGVLKYTSRDITYRVERNFMKGHDEVKIFDDDNGEDLTYMFEYDSALRICKPTSLHLGLNSVVFNNTISIKQLGSRTDADLSKEIKDSLINLGGSLDEDISVKKVIERLDGKITSIGTKGRVKTSPYGKIVKELEDLAIEEEKAQRLHDEIKELQVNVNSINDGVAKLKEQRNDINHKIRLFEGFNVKKRLKEALKIIDDIKELDTKTKELEVYSRLSGDDYTKAIEENSNMTNIRELLDDIKKKHLELENKMEKLNDELSKSPGFDGINEDEVEELVNMFVRMEEKKNEVIDYENKIKELEEKISSKGQQDLLSINDDIYEYEKLEVEKNNFIYDKDYSNRAYLKSRLDEKESQLKKLNSFKIISLLIMLVTLTVGFLVNPLAYVTVTIPVLMFLYSAFSSREVKKYISKLKKQLVEIDTNEMLRKAKINSLDMEMKAILRRQGCSTKGELLIKANEHSAENALIKDKRDKVNEIKERIPKILEEIDKYHDIIRKCLNQFEKDCDMSLHNVKRLKERYNIYTRLMDDKHRIEEELKNLQLEEYRLQTNYDKKIRALDEILTKNRVRDLDEFKDGLEKKKDYEKLLIKKDNQTGLLNKVLNSDSIEALRRKAMGYNDINIDKLPEIDIENLKKALEKTNDDLRTNLEELSRLEERIYNYSSNIRPLVEIREDIIKREKIRDNFENKLKSLNLAKDVINKISKEIQRDFAPELNKKVGRIINTITNGKYSDVKITENLDIKVIDPSREIVVDIDSLSGGTIDQLYFATRLGIIDIIKGDSSFPIILDDCFTQYDIHRLTNIMGYISQESKKRQILLFTCHEREKDILDKANIEYNYIEI